MMKTREYTRKYLDYVLKIIGEEGKLQERRYFVYAEEEPSERGKELCLMKAKDFVNYRKKWLNAVKQGEYTAYGITADDIVE